MELKNLIQQYLEQTKMMQLATSANDQPWICNVWFAADADLNIYWFSGKSRRHCAEVIENPRVAGAVVFPQTPEDVPRGVQFQGTTTRLTNEADIQAAISLYAGRIFPEAKIQQLMQPTAPNPHDFYRITPELFVLFDAVNFPTSSRQEYRPN